MKKLTIIFFWLILFLLVFLSSLKENTIVSQIEIKKNINALFPEGWGFFTRNPLENEMLIYKYDSNNKLTKISLLNQSVNNYFGLSRNSRLLSYDLSNIIELIPKEVKWETKIGENLKFKNNNMNPILLKKNNRIKLIKCGKYLILNKKRLPYTWINKGQEKFTEQKIINIILN